MATPAHRSTRPARPARPTQRTRRGRAGAVAPAGAEPPPRWLLLVHQLPASPSRLRVKIWRRLQAVGAVAVKGSVYVLPASAQAHEDFEWLRGEIVTLGGEAIVLTAEAVDEQTTSEIVDAFSAARRRDWNELAERVAAARLAAGRGGELERELRLLHGRAAQIEKIDFFPAGGRQEALAALAALAGRASEERRDEPASERPRLAVADYRGRRWLTRPRPGIDRIASAWLIRRFIDPAAEFHFAERIPPGEEVVPFDMFGVELGHQGDRCTFETLLAAFGLGDPALDRLARIVRDLDLRIEAVDDLEAATVGRIVEGLRLTNEDDRQVLEHGCALFEAFYRSLSA
jgi:hypothetical protein